MWMTKEIVHTVILSVVSKNSFIVQASCLAMPGMMPAVCGLSSASGAGPKI